MSARGYYLCSTGSLLLAFWLAAFYCVQHLLFGGSWLTIIVACIMGVLGMFAIYCAFAGSHKMELESVEDDWDRIIGKLGE